MRDFSIDLVWAKLQMAIAAVGGWLGYFVGGVDGLMTALLVLMVMDYVTGIMCAVIDRELSSSVGFRGIFKKVLILMLVSVAHIVDLHVVRSGEALRSAVICFYLSNEGVSVLENAGHLGLPIPESSRPSWPSCTTAWRSRTRRRTAASDRRPLKGGKCHVRTRSNAHDQRALCGLLSLHGGPALLVRHLRATRSRVNHCSARDRTRHSVDGSLPPLA